MIGNDGILNSPGLASELLHPHITTIIQRGMLRVRTIADLPTAGPINEGLLATIISGATILSEGPLSPGTLASAAEIGSVAWSNPGNAASSNDSYATAVLDLQETHYLKATNFGFAIPAGVTIKGIEIAAECSISVGSLTTEITTSKIIKGGVVGSTNNANGTDFTTTDTYLTMGGSTSLWNESWAYSDLNLSTFGVAISVGATVGASIAQIDHIRAKVYYQTLEEIGSLYRSMRNADGSHSWRVIATNIDLGTA